MESQHPSQRSPATGQSAAIALLLQTEVDRLAKSFHRPRWDLRASDVDDIKQDVIESVLKCIQRHTDLADRLLEPEVLQRYLSTCFWHAAARLLKQRQYRSAISLSDALEPSASGHKASESELAFARRVFVDAIRANIAGGGPADFALSILLEEASLEDCARKERASVRTMQRRFATGIAELRLVIDRIAEIHPREAAQDRTDITGIPSKPR